MLALSHNASTRRLRSAPHRQRAVMPEMLEPRTLLSLLTPVATSDPAAHAPAARNSAQNGGPTPARHHTTDNAAPVTPAATGSWQNLAATNPDAGPANGQALMLLSDGTVMIQGGSNAATTSWYRLSPNAAGSYAAGTWSALPSMTIPRLYFPTAMLRNGTVLALGGEYTVPTDQANTGEIFDPTNGPTGAWNSIQNFPQTLFGDDPVEVLPDGQVLAGYIFDGRTYRYNPTANTWTQTAGSKLRNDRSDEETWVKLPDNSILSYDIFASVSTNTFHAQRYIPSTDRWVDASNLNAATPAQILSDGPSTAYAQGAELGPAFLTPDGKAIFFGANGKTAIYDPQSDTWSAGPPEPSRLVSGTTGQLVATDNPGAMLPNGRILIAFSPLGSLNSSGNYTFPAPSYIYEYDPTTQSFADATPAGIANENAFQLNMLVLPDGTVLLANEAGPFEIYTPADAPQNAWRPTVSSIVNTGPSFTLTGTQLNGISEGASFGDDKSMASNYPIVRLTDSSTGVSQFARTFNWSSTGVATGNTPQTVQFTRPSGIGTNFSAVVIANGIASTPFAYTQPVNQFPFAAITTPSSPGTGDIAIQYSLADPTSQVCSMTVEYSTDSGANWFTATIAPGSLGITGLSSSPDGSASSFIWASATDIANANSANVRIRITPFGSAIGTAAVTDPFTVNNQGIPANDNFANRALLSGISASVTGSNVGASKEIGEPNVGGRTGGHSVWWTWTAPSSMFVQFDTFGSNFDTLLSVFTGSDVASLTVVARNDDAGGGNNSRVRFIASAGVQYQIAVDGFGGAVGNLTLNLLQLPPTNDNFAFRTAIIGDLPLSLAGTNTDSSIEIGETSHGDRSASHSVWWSWVAPVTTSVQIDTAGSDFDTLLSVYTGTSLSSLASIAQNDDAGGGLLTSRVLFNAVAGTQYQIAVDGYSGAVGAISLNLLQTTAPSNDNFASGTPLTGLSSTVAASNVFATSEPSEPAHDGIPASRSLWWTWTSPGNAAFQLDTVGSDFDTVLALYTGNSLPTLQSVAADDDSGGNLTSRLSFAATAGTTYQIAVDGYFGDVGTIALHLHLLLTADANNDGIVDIADMVVIANNWNLHYPTLDYAHGELNGDGIVDIADMIVVANNWNHTLSTDLSTDPTLSAKPAFLLTKSVPPPTTTTATTTPHSLRPSKPPSPHCLPSRAATPTCASCPPTRFQIPTTLLPITLPPNPQLLSLNSER